MDRPELLLLVFNPLRRKSKYYLLCRRETDVPQNMKSLEGKDTKFFKEMSEVEHYLNSDVRKTAV